MLIDAQLPRSVLREEWSAWRAARHAALRAEMIPVVAAAARTVSPSDQTLLMHASTLEAIVRVPADGREAPGTADAARAHLSWILSAATTIGGLRSSAQQSLVAAISHLVEQGVHAPLVFALTPTPPPVEPLPRLAYHWPLDGTLREAISGVLPASGMLGSSIVAVTLPPINGVGVGEAVRFAGDGNTASVLVNVHGLSTAALSISVWVRVGVAAGAWTSLWTFDVDSGAHRLELSNSADPQLWSANPTARVSTAYGAAQTTLFDGEWHHIATVYDDTHGIAALYVDGVRLVGTYSGTTGRSYVGTGNLMPRAFAFGHSPWSQSATRSDVILRDLRVWDGALTANQVHAELGATAISSPPPPPPSPPPFGNEQLPPLTREEAIESAKRASAELEASLDALAKLALQVMLPGQAPLLVTAGNIHALWMRTTVEALRSANLTMQLNYAPLPVEIVMPQSLALVDAASGMAIAEAEPVDVQFVAWGTDMQGWRLSAAARRQMSLTEGHIAPAVSNLTSLALCTAIGSRPLLANSQSATELIEITMPIGEDPWPVNSAARGAAQQQHEALEAQQQQQTQPSSSDPQACYGAPRHPCNDHGRCVRGMCLCDLSFVGENCTQRIICHQLHSEQFASAGCRVLARQGGTVRCGCKWLSTSFSVLKKDVAQTLPRVGCTDTEAWNFDVLAELHTNDACVYASPPPPIDASSFITVATWMLSASWMALWLLCAGVTECLAQDRHDAGRPDVRLQPPLLRPSTFARRLALRIWHSHSYLWPFHLWDFTQRTRHRLNASQALLLTIAPILATWTGLLATLELCRWLRETNGIGLLTDTSANALLLGNATAGGSLLKLALWHAALLVTAVSALLRETFRALLHRANWHVHMAELHASHEDQAGQQLHSMVVPREAYLKKTGGPLGRGFVYNTSIARMAVHHLGGSSNTSVERARDADPRSFNWRASAFAQTSTIKLHLTASILDQYHWVPVLSAHALPDDDGLFVTYSRDRLAKVANHTRLRPNLDSVMRLAAITLPETAYSESVGGFYRRVRHVAPEEPFRAVDLEFVPVVHAHPAPESHPTVGERPTAHAKAVDGNRGTRECVDIGAADELSSVSMVWLYYPLDTIAEPIDPSQVCRNFEVAQELLGLGNETPIGSDEGVAVVEEGTLKLAGSPPPDPWHGRQRRITMAQARTEDAAALTEWYGQDAGRGTRASVPTLSVTADRIFQRAMSSLLFARPCELSRSDVQLGPLIGRGVFGKVFHCVHLRQVEQRLAMRVFSGSRHETRALMAVAMIAEVLQRVRDERVLPILGVCTSLPQPFVLMECAECGSFGELLHTPTVRSVHITIQLTLLRDAAHGMAHLHRHAIRHFNLRAANLMLWGSPLRVKVSDPRLRIEWLTVGDGGMVTTAAAAHRPWYAPEVLVALQPDLAGRRGRELAGHGVNKCGAGLTAKRDGCLSSASAGSTSCAMSATSENSRWPTPSISADVYSFGMVLFEVLSRTLPFSGEPEAAWLVTALGSRPKLPQAVLQREESEPLLRAMADIMCECWVEAPLERPSFPSLLPRLEALRQEALEELDTKVDDPTASYQFLEAQLLRSRAAAIEKARQAPVAVIDVAGAEAGDKASAEPAEGHMLSRRQSENADLQAAFSQAARIIKQERPLGGAQRSMSCKSSEALRVERGSPVNSSRQAGAQSQTLCKGEIIRTAAPFPVVPSIIRAKSRIRVDRRLNVSATGEYDGSMDTAGKVGHTDAQSMAVQSSHRPPPDQFQPSRLRRRHRGAIEAPPSVRRLLNSRVSPPPSPPSLQPPVCLPKLVSEQLRVTAGPEDSSGHVCAYVTGERRQVASSPAICVQRRRHRHVHTAEPPRAMRASAMWQLIERSSQLLSQVEVAIREARDWDSYSNTEACAQRCERIARAQKLARMAIKMHNVVMHTLTKYARAHDDSSAILAEGARLTKRRKEVEGNIAALSACNPPASLVENESLRTLPRAAISVMCTPRPEQALAPELHELLAASVDAFERVQAAVRDVGGPDAHTMCQPSARVQRLLALSSRVNHLLLAKLAKEPSSAAVESAKARTMNMLQTASLVGMPNSTAPNAGSAVAAEDLGHLADDKTTPVNVSSAAPLDVAASAAGNAPTEATGWPAVDLTRVAHRCDGERSGDASWDRPAEAQPEPTQSALIPSRRLSIEPLRPPLVASVPTVGLKEERLAAMADLLHVHVQAAGSTALQRAKDDQFELKEAFELITTASTIFAFISSLLDALPQEHERRNISRERMRAIMHQNQALEREVRRVFLGEAVHQPEEPRRDTQGSQWLGDYLRADQQHTTSVKESSINARSGTSRSYGSTARSHIITARSTDISSARPWSTPRPSATVGTRHTSLGSAAYVAQMTGLMVDLGLEKDVAVAFEAAFLPRGRRESYMYSGVSTGRSSGGSSRISGSVPRGTRQRLSRAVSVFGEYLCRCLAPCKPPLLAPCHLLPIYALAMAFAPVSMGVAAFVLSPSTEEADRWWVGIRLALGLDALLQPVLQLIGMLFFPRPAASFLRHHF